MASTAWTGWEAEGDDEARFKAWLNASWLTVRWLACAAAWGLAVSIPFGFNYEWNHARGWYYVAFAILTASLAPSMVSCIASLNLGKRARLFCTFLMIGCLCYDWSNAARVHVADQDKQHASAAFTQSESDNATKDRARLESQIEEADKAADRKPVGKLEAELQLAKDKATTTWESYTTRRGRKTATITARPQRFKDEVTKAEGRLKSARDRDAKQSELKLLPSVEATPAAADSGVETVKTVLDWFGIHNLSKETYSRILALWDTGLMQLLCLVGPHGMFFFLFGALAPDAAHRRRLQEATEKAANKATREATRTVKNAMWGRWRENAAAAIKARFTRKKPPVYVPEPEAAPEPERRFEDEFGEDMRDVVEGLEVAPEPAAKPAPKAQEWRECRDSAIEAIANSRLQKEEGKRFDTREFFNEVWVPWHREMGREPGKQNAMTTKLKASGLFQTFPSGGKTWVADWSIMAKKERPKLRIVN